MHKRDQIRQVLQQPEPALQPATLHWSASCNILSQRHPIHQRIVLPCQLQHFTPMPVSATNCRPRPRHTEQILNIQVCTCLTTVRSKKKTFNRICSTTRLFVQNGVSRLSPVSAPWWPHNMTLKFCISMS